VSRNLFILRLRQRQIAWRAICPNYFPPFTSSNYLISCRIALGSCLQFLRDALPESRRSQLELNTLQAPKPHRRALQSSASARDLAVVYLGQMPRPAGPFAIYGSPPPGVTLGLPDTQISGAPVTRNPPPLVSETAYRGRGERLSVTSSHGHFPCDCWQPVAAHWMPRPSRSFEQRRHCRARERQPELRVGADRQQ
jgi:hypothetical protein